MVQSPEKNADKKDKVEPILKTGAETHAVQKVPEPASTAGKKNNKDSKKKGNSFFLTLSAGPDISSAGAEKTG